MVVRDTNGRWLMGFHKSCFATDPFAAELMGVYEALKFAAYHDFQDAVIYSDSRNVVNLLHKEEIADLYFNLLEMCRTRWSDLHGVEIQYYMREDNMVVDALEKTCKLSELDCNVIRIFSHPLVTL